VRDSYDFVVAVDTCKAFGGINAGLTAILSVEHELAGPIASPYMIHPV